MANKIGGVSAVSRMVRIDIDLLTQCGVQHAGREQFVESTS